MAKYCPLVSIIVLNYNDKEHIVRCLKSILNSNYKNIEVIVVDQGSTDSSLEVIKEIAKHDSRVKIVPLKMNVGISLGRNIGALHAKGDILCFVDSDLEVSSDWLCKLIRIFEKNKRIGACQCNILSAEDKKTSLISLCYMDICGVPLIIKLSPRKAIYEVFYAAGGCFVTRRNLFFKLGMFDPHLFFFYEDADFSYRLLITGHKVYSVLDCVVYHPSKSTTVSRRFEKVKSVYYWTRSHFIFLLKNFEIPILVPGVLVATLLVLIHAIYDIYLKKADVAFARIKALIDIIKLMKTIIAQRKYVQSMRRISDKTLIKRGIIIPRLLRLARIFADR